MEFLRTARQRSILSETLYIALNLALAIAVFLAVWAFQTPLIALLIVLISKWRVLAVRPRYWLANIQANLVDLVVSFGFVGLIYYSSALPAQLVITLLYIAWLFFLKPQSKPVFMVIQAHVAGVVGITALMNVSYSWPLAIVVLLMWLIGYSAARHILTAYQEKQVSFIALLWGFVIAQLGWLAYHWTIAYALPGTGGLMLPQLAIVVFFFGFLAERVYHSKYTHGQIQSSDVILPVLLSVSVVMILLLLFNSIGTGAI